jgi:hypothetical protein
MPSLADIGCAESIIFDRIIFFGARGYIYFVKSMILARNIFIAAPSDLRRQITVAGMKGFPDG